MQTLSKGVLTIMTVGVLAVTGGLAELVRRKDAATNVFNTRQPALLGTEQVMSPPSPKEDVRAEVAVAISFNATSHVYTYTYTLTNRSNSGNAINEWGVAPVPSPLDVAAPSHWKGFYGWDDRSDAVVWSVWDGAGATTPADTTNQTLNVTMSPYAAQPGTNTSGFAIKTYQGPVADAAPITWYAQGFDTLLDEAEEPEEPGLPSQQTLFVQSVQGPIGGPDINGVVSVNETPSSVSRLNQPLPNPTRKGVLISYYLPKAASVKLAVFDVSGRRVALLAEGDRPAGLHSVSWTGRDDTGLAQHAGVYFSQLMVDGRKVGDRKITILK